MTATLTMPRMGETMESGRIASWLKKPGDSFRRGETILEIETDKVTVEMPALDDGRLIEILATEGTEVAVGEALGRYDRSKTVAPANAPEAKVKDSGTAAPPDTTPRAAGLTALTLPRMGETMEEGRVVAWLKQPGQAFKRGDVIVEIETDKTTVEVPALVDGQLVDIVAHPGTSVAVGAPIGHYSHQGGAVATPVPSAASSDTSAPPLAAPILASVLDAKPTPVEQPPAAAAPHRLRATPLARRMARTCGVDLAALVGSGRRARIEKRDVEAALATRGSEPAARAEVSTPGVLFLDLPDGRLAYRDWSPATMRGTVLFLHGFSADGATWAGFASALTRQGLRVIAPDLPGHGATTLEAEAHGDMTAAVLALTARLGLQGCHLVAHSMGAAVAVRAALEGLRLSRLTLVAPAGLGSEIDADFVTGMAEVRSAGALPHLLRRLARRIPPMSRPQLDLMAADFARGRLKRLAENLVDGGRQAVDIVADLRVLQVPTRIVWGVEDRIIPWTQVAQVPSAMPIHLIAGAGHMPHWDNPQDLAALFT